MNNSSKGKTARVGALVVVALDVEACSKKGKANGPNESKMILLEYYIKFGPRISRVMCIFRNKRLQHGEQVTRNLGIKSFLSQNWGHVFISKFGKKNAGTRSFHDCIIKGSIARGSISADSDAVLGLALFG